MASIADHQHNLEKLCRVCGKILSEKDSYNIKRDLKTIQDCFRSNFILDNPEIHPQILCNVCYSSMIKVSSRGSVHSIEPILWKPHSNGECFTCLRVKQKSKGGRPSKNRGSVGRSRNPTKVTSWESAELPNSVYLSSPNEGICNSLKLMDIDLNLNPNLKHCICSICKDLMLKPLVVSQCDHSFCGLCLTNSLKTSPLCPECHVSIPVNDSAVRRGLFFSRLLNEAKVQCKCGSVVSIATYDDHKCVSTPLLPNITTGDIMQLSPSKPIPRVVQESVYHVIGIMQQQQATILPKGTVQIQTNGYTVRELFINYLKATFIIKYP